MVSSDDSDSCASVDGASRATEGLVGRPERRSGPETMSGIAEIDEFLRHGEVVATFVQRRIRNLVFLFIGLFFIAILSWLTAALGLRHLPVFPLAVLWPLMTGASVVFTYMTICPGRLWVTTEGLVTHRLWITKAYPWDRVANFRVWLPGNVKIIAYDDLRPVTGTSALRKMIKAAGAEGSLGLDFGPQAKEIAHFLNAERQRWVDRTMPGSVERPLGRTSLHPTVETVSAETPAALPTRGGRPWATWITALLLVLVFAVEISAPLDRPRMLTIPTARTLFAYGALSRDAMLRSGEWWRLLSGFVLDANVPHLLANIFVLVLVGPPLERAVGRAWFVTIFLLGGIAGAIASLTTGAPHSISVGASGAIMAILVCTFCVSYGFPAADPRRARMQSIALRVLIPSLLPLEGSNAGLRVDYASHFGGALLGGLVGVGLWRSWSKAGSVTPGLGLARGLSLTLSAALLASGVAVAWRFPLYVHSARLIPPSRLARTYAQMRQFGPALLHEYPEDPRSHAYAATVAFQNGNMQIATAQLRDALRLTLSFDGPKSPRVINTLRSMLGQALLQSGQREQAIEAVRPVCVASPNEQPSRQALNYLLQTGLCPTAARH